MLVGAFVVVGIVVANVASRGKRIIQITEYGFFRIIFHGAENNGDAVLFEKVDSSRPHAPGNNHVGSLLCQPDRQ